MKLFERSPGIDAATYAEAQALVDDGLEPEFVLDLYPEDAAWLAPLLKTSAAFSAAAAANQPSYFFEATLKAKFLAAAAAQQAGVRATAPAVPGYAPGPFHRFRTALAGAAVLGAAALMSILTLGLVTADKSVPGDWNYVFKRTNERLEYTLSRGNTKVDVQLKQTDARVYEIQQQVRDGGSVSTADLERLQHEADALAQAARQAPLDTQQKARLADLGERSVAVLGEVRQKQAALAPAVETTINTVSTAVAAGLGTGGVTPLGTPTASATATTAATPTGSATSTATPDPTATGTPTAAPKTAVPSTPTPESDTSSPPVRPPAP